MKGSHQIQDSSSETNREEPQVKIEINSAWIGSVFLFKAMLTPKIITFVYWLALLGCLGGGIAAMGQRTMGVLPGLAIMIGGPDSR